MLICTITSKVTAQVHGIALEPGFYELAVDVSAREALGSGDPRGFVKKTIAQHLAVCVRETELPLGEGLWDIRFSLFAQTELNLPEGFTV